MPADNSLGLHYDQNIGPPRPASAERGPEKPVQPVPFGPRVFAFEQRELLSRGQDFQGGITPTTQKNPECCDNGEAGLEHEPRF